MTAQTSIPSGTDTDRITAALTTAIVAPLTGLGWLRVTGEDRVRWLNGMLTNSIQTLAAGEGTYNFALSAQGRIQADATVFALPDELRVESNRAAELATLLDRFIIMDDVELTPAGEAYAGLLLAGPLAMTLLQGLLQAQSIPEEPLRLASIKLNGRTIELIHAHSPLIPRFELWSDPATIAELTSALPAAGALLADAATLEDLRLLEGTPLYGVDLRDKELPQETAQSGQVPRALHFNKGCYLGQEIVERIHSRGNVHRVFSGFLLTGGLPAPGTALMPANAPEGQRPVGEITSARTIQLAGGPVHLALGYIRRDALERGETLEYAGGRATPCTLPWPRARGQ